MVFLCRIRRDSGAFGGSRFGTFCEDFEMNALLVALASVPPAEAVKMLSSGAMLAIAIYKAAKMERGRKVTYLHGG